MTAADFTAAELTFLNRALPHMLSGKSAIDAMQAVLEDDARLFCAMNEKMSVPCIGAQGDGGPLYNVEGTESAKTLASTLSAEVYRKLRA